MRILAIDPIPSSERGGQEKSLFDILLGLRGLGHFVSIAYTKEGDLIRHYIQSGVEPIRIAKTHLDEKNIKTAIQLISSILSLSRHNFDVIYINEITDLTIAAILSKIKKIKIVCHLRLPPPKVPIFKQRTNFIGLLHRHVCQYIVASKNMLDLYIESGLNEKTLKIIPNGFWFDELTPRTHKLGKDSPLKICYLGRITEQKGVRELILGFSILVRKHSNLTLSIGGSPKRPEHEAYLERIKKDISELNIGDKVRFLGHIKDPHAFLSKHDLCIFPSIEHESFGRVLVESLVSGTPVIANNIGSTSEILNDPSRDWIYNNQFELVEKIENFIANPHLYNLSARQKYVIENYNLNSIILMIERVLLDAAKCGNK
jgi:glycosyltransferase involved in cell wall biosynthesis